MSKPAVSIFVFDIYLELLGLVLMTAPNLILNLPGMPSTGEVWTTLALRSQTS